MSNSGNPQSRRRFLKGAASGSLLATTALAGCAGQGGDGGGGTTVGGNGASPTPEGSTGMLTADMADMDLSGVSFEFWDFFNTQSDLASQQLRKIVSDFEDETGVNIEPNWSSAGEIVDGTWRQNMGRGQRPAVYDTSNIASGQFIEPGWVKPVDEFRELLDDEALAAMETTITKSERAYAGFDADLYEVPVSTSPAQPFIARRDHFEEAGLDFESDFPPRDFDHLIEVASALQADGPADWGFQAYGEPFDGTKLPSVIGPTRDANDGMTISDDWSEFNVDTQTWIDTMEDLVSLLREHELTSPETPAGNDEQAARLVMNGRASMTSVDALTYGLIASEAPDMLADGTIQFAPMWEGESGLRGKFFANTLGIVRPPEDADFGEWRKKQIAAIKFINRLISSDFQGQVPNLFSGGLPAREDAWSAAAENTEGGYIESISPILNQGKAEAGHPDWITYNVQIMGPTFQKAWLGDLTPKEACEEAAASVREQLDSF